MAEGGDMKLLLRAGRRAADRLLYPSHDHGCEQSLFTLAVGRAQNAIIL